MTLSIPFCYGRNYPRRPRGESVGCLDNNWPARWEQLSGPTAVGAFAPFNDHQLVYTIASGLGSNTQCQWDWKESAFGRSVTLTCQAANANQTKVYWRIVAARPAFGSILWQSDDFDWGNPGEITLPYISGNTAGWVNKEFDFVIQRSLYTTLPPGFCELSR